MERPHRVVVAHVGPDEAGGGADSLARTLRDAGVEVIWAGRSQTAEQVAETALQEDADAVGVVGDPDAVKEELRQRGLADVVVIGPASTTEWLAATG